MRIARVAAILRPAAKRSGASDPGRGDSARTVSGRQAQTAAITARAVLIGIDFKSTPKTPSG